MEASEFWGHVLAAVIVLLFILSIMEGVIR